MNGGSLIANAHFSGTVIANGGLVSFTGGVNLNTVTLAGGSVEIGDWPAGVSIGDLIGK